MYLKQFDYEYTRLTEPITTQASRVASMISSKGPRIKTCIVLSAFIVTLGFLQLCTSSGAYVLLGSEKLRGFTNSDAAIPRKIWQIFLNPPSANSSFVIDPSKMTDAAYWIARNPDYQYRLVDDRAAADFVSKFDQVDPRLRPLYHQLPNTGMKSDLLRYVILYLKGGIYGDTDTQAIKPVDNWIPMEYRKDTRVIVGIEFDRLDGSNWGEVHEDLQFCQWTIAASPKHHLFKRMTEMVIEAVGNHTSEHNQTLSDVEIKSGDVMKLTGPAIWTDAVFAELQLRQPNLTSVRNLTGMTEPRLIGDMLVLPIDGFGMGQKHSNSTHDGSIPEGALVQHNFKGTWRQET